MFDEIILHHFQKIDSTNNWAKQNISAFDSSKMTLVSAIEQTAGRGRFNRTWQSPPHQNIYATFCFSVLKPSFNLSNISLITSVSITQVLSALGFSVSLKWPNDVLIGGKKVGGILCETQTLNNRLWWLLGMGININMPATLLNQIDQPATSLFLESSESQDLELIFTLLKAQVMSNINLFLENGFDPFLETYKKLICYNPRQRLSCLDGLEYVEGKFHSIDTDGSLLLLLDNNRLKKIFSGEVSHLKIQ